MKRLNIILLIITNLVISSIGFAQGNLGQSGANFLQIDVDPRGAALGGAITAVSEGAAALYWNPAGMIHTQNLDVNLSHTDWFLDTKLMYAGIAKNMGTLGIFGLSVTSFYMDEMEITTVYNSEGTGDFYNAGDLAIGASYARSLTDRFTFGATVKFVREEIWNESASQVAFDVGSLYRTDFYNLRLGMVIRNFAGKLKFSGDDIDQRIQEETELNIPNNPRIERLTPEFRLPQVFQMGIAFEPFQMESSRLTILADVNVPSDNQQRVIFGAEYDFLGIASIRGAYKLNDDVDEFSFGGGIHLNVINVNTRLDYSYSTHSVLESVHRFGLGFSVN